MQHLYHILCNIIKGIRGQNGHPALATGSKQRAHNAYRSHFAGPDGHVEGEETRSRTRIEPTTGHSAARECARSV